MFEQPTEIINYHPFYSNLFIIGMNLKINSNHNKTKVVLLIGVTNIYYTLTSFFLPIVPVKKLCDGNKLAVNFCPC